MYKYLAFTIILVLVDAPLPAHGESIDPAVDARAPRGNVPAIYWSNLTPTDYFIRRGMTDGTRIDEVVPVTRGVRGMAIDEARDMVYWADVELQTIQKASIHGGEVIDVITSGLDWPMSLAIDSGGGKIYWLDQSTDKIGRANLDGSDFEYLVSGSMSSGLALDVAAGKMYWTESITGDTGAIFRANMDGTRVEILISDAKPGNIALDVAAGKIYWTDHVIDRVRRANLDGSEIEDLFIAPGGPNPGAISLDLSAGKVYWGQDRGYLIGDIMRMNLDGSNPEVVLYDVGGAVESQVILYEGPPTPATELAASDGTRTEHVALSWTFSFYADEYRVYRNTEDDPDGAVPVSDWQAATAFDDETADPGETHWYWILARNQFGESGFSEPDDGYRWLGPPAPPSELEATDGDYVDHVHVTWSGLTTADDYRVYRHTEPDPESSAPISDWIAETVYDDETAEPGEVYWYWVKARNEYGESDFSEGDAGNSRSSGPLYVPADYPTIQEAIDVVKPGETIWVADGVYTGPLNKNLDFGGKDITVRSENGPENCIIDCEEDGRGFWFHNGESRDAFVIGFTIINGARMPVSSAGGGMLIDGGSPTVENCVFENNTVTGGAGDGGGVALIQGAPVFTDCLFLRNDAEGHNGGMGGGFFSMGTPTLVRCVFRENYSWAYGGGMASRGASAELVDCIFEDNSVGRDHGGGLYTRDATLSGCRFISNGASNGGGLYFYRGDSVMTDCVVQANGSEQGGGVYIADGSLSAQNCRFDQNGADWGGALHINSGTHGFVNCTFSHNRSRLETGGGLYVREAEVTATNCSIYENFTESGSGGGVFVGSTGNVTITNSILWANTPDAANRAEITYSNVQGGWFGEGNINADPRFIDPENDDLRLRFGSPAIDAGDNRAVPGDVEVDLDGGPRFEDDPQTDDTGRCDDICVRPIVDMGPYEYRPVAPDAPTDLVATDGDFAERVAINWSESLYAGEYRVHRHTANDPDAAVPISDWQGETDFDDTTGQPGQTYWYWVQSRNILGASELSAPDTGYTRALPPPPPTEVDASDATYHDRVAISWVGNAESDEYRVHRNTDSDPNGAVPVSPWLRTTDFDDGTIEPGQTYWYWLTGRNQFGEGAFSEGDTGRARTVRTLRVPDGYATIQVAIDSAFTGDTIVVGDGVYTGSGNRDLDFGGRDIVLRSENGPEMCIIDCGGTENNRHRGFNFHSGETSEAVVEGFTIQNGYAPTQQRNRNAGGAIAFDYESSPTIRNCVFRLNYADEDGGAVRIFNSSPRFENCRIEQNSARTNGGGVAVFSGAAVFLDCAITENLSNSWGGGVRLNSTNARFIRCSITNNRSDREGGGIASRGERTQLLEQCTIAGNRAPTGGGIFCDYRSSIELIGCVVRDNEADIAGGAILADEPSLLKLVNCVVWRNSATGTGGIDCREGVARIINSAVVGNVAGVRVAGADVLLANSIVYGNSRNQISVAGDVDPVVRFCDIEGGWEGEGNINADPRFMDIGNGDLHLAAGSPCIDAADNRSVPDGVAFDLDGLDRFVDDPDTEDTGRCEEPCVRSIVDMGAYEYSIGACCVDEFESCTDGVPAYLCQVTRGRFQANVFCGDLDPPCGADCVRDPRWQCDGDVDGDGQVNPVDSGLVRAAFGTTDEQDLCNYDLDCDGQINPVDAGIVQSLFGTCDAPRGACP